MRPRSRSSWRGLTMTTTTRLGPPRRRLTFARYVRVTDGLHATTAAIIMHGFPPVAPASRVDQLALALLPLQNEDSLLFSHFPSGDIQPAQSVLPRRRHVDTSPAQGVRALGRKCPPLFVRPKEAA